MAVENMLQDTFNESYNLFKKQYVVFIVGAIITVLGSVFIITAPPLMFGLYFMSLKLIEGKKVEISDVFKGFNYFVVSWIMFIIGAIAIFFGMLFLIIPGLLLMVLFQYAIPIAISENLGAIDALKKSFRIGKENLVFSIILWLLIAITNGIGSAISVGWLLTYPFTAIATCIAVQKLTAVKGKK